MRDCCLFYAKQSFIVCMECNRKIVHEPPILTCSAWKPINDDALDGQMRILSDGGRVMTGAWEPNNAKGFSWFSEDSKILPMQPTHWMPLPEPPTEDTNE